MNSEEFEQVKKRAIEIHDEVFEKHFSKHAYSLGKISLPDLTDNRLIDEHTRLAKEAFLPKSHRLRARLATQIRNDLTQGKKLTWPIIMLISKGLTGDIPATKLKRPTKKEWLYPAIAEIIFHLKDEFKNNLIKLTRNELSTHENTIIDAVSLAIHEQVRDVDDNYRDKGPLKLSYETILRECYKPYKQ